MILAWRVFSPASSRGISKLTGHAARMQMKLSTHLSIVMVALVMVTAATITVPALIFPVVAGHPSVVPAALVAIVSGSGFAVLFSRLLTGALTQLTQAALALPHDE